MTPSYDPATHVLPSYLAEHAAFLAGTRSPRDVLETCLEVIAEKEPRVRAFVVMQVEAARAAADASSARWRDGRPLSPIDGMPMGIKDLLLTRDMPTQMGCKAYEGHFPRADNAAVWALREAGAVILGKTVTTELGGFQPGPTTNPFDPGRTPGGSSSGTSAAIGAGMIPAGIGSQVAGSIIRPAGYCANYALKPSQGVLTRGERQATSMSTHGPHAGTLEDMWAVAMAIATRAGGDPGFAPLAGPETLPAAQRPLCVAVMETEAWPELDTASRTAFEAVLDQLRTAGVTVLRRGALAQLERFERSIEGCLSLNVRLTAWETHWGLRNLLAEHPDGVSARGRRGLQLAAELGVEGYRAGMHARAMIQAEYAALMATADLVISPASIGPAPRWSPEDPVDPEVIPTGSPAMNAPGSLIGCPAVTLPLTAVGGLPMGIQVMGRTGADAGLVAMARWMRDTLSPVSVAA